MKNDEFSETLELRTRQFAIAIMKMSLQLSKDPQLDKPCDCIVRSGVSVGANYWEAFRLTDDGEIEPVHSRRIEKEKPALRQQHSRRYERDDDDDERKQAYKSRRRKRDKKHRKDDTDEFDVRKLLKKLKDIID